MSPLFVDIIQIVAGLVLLFAGGEALVRGAVGIAKRVGLSELVIGLTVVGFGTSMPELLVSVKAATGGMADIAIGNVVGSNIANVLLIVGLATLLLPAEGWNRTVRRDAVVMILASLALATLAWSGTISRPTGAVFVILLLAYVVYAYVDDRRLPAEEQPHVDIPAPPVIRSVGYVAAGFLALFFGADQLVNGSVAIARLFGVSEAVIGLTIVAVGTSLPELATSVIAARRGNSDVALGNIVGSNIFNILGILGITAMIAPMTPDARFVGFDIPVMVAVALGFAFLLVATHRIGRGAGALMLALYVAYTASLFAT